MTAVSYTHLDVYKRQIKTNETLIQVREEILNKVNNVEEESKNRIEGIQQETVGMLEQMKEK